MDEEQLEERVVIVVEKGMVTEVYSTKSNETIIVVDIDNQNIGEESITEYSWPETQYDDERVAELLKSDGDNNDN